MCGIVGIVGRTDVNQDLYDALTALQHRGQDAAGIFTCDLKIHQRKANGLVRDVFQPHHMHALRGRMGVGHIRYPTAGSESSAEAQPFYVNSPYGIALAHNGNLINADALGEEIFRDELRHVNTESDSEILLNIFASELARGHRIALDENTIFDAVAGIHRRCLGGYAAVALIYGYGVVAFRDPCAIRPLCFGVRETTEGKEYMVASESVALDALGYELVRDLRPGEAIVITLRGEVHARQCFAEPRYAPCIFEYVYLARPDSIIDDVSVYKARLRMGEALAEKIVHEWPDHDIDVVIPIPETSRTACLPLAYDLGVKYREGFIKNRYVERTFIMPGQIQRMRSVRRKLNAIGLEFVGKNVLLVDDSIVRGTTSRQIIQQARDAGARRVYFASAAPPVRYQNVYGIDMPATGELVAFNRSEDDVARAIGADRLIYQSVEGLVEAVQRGNPRLREFDTSCFTGEYVTGGVSSSYLEQIAEHRADSAKSARAAAVHDALELQD
jgi:amidophosphoribosyltransferase